MVCPRWVWIFFMQKALFYVKSIDSLELAGYVGDAAATAADMFLIRDQALGRWFSSSREH